MQEKELSFNNYPAIKKMFYKLATCGQKYAIFLTPEGEKVEKVVYCDNRVCFNPYCQDHRQYQYEKAHRNQIDQLDKDIRSPKGWVFSTPAKSFPINRDYCRSEIKRLYNLLQYQKHRGYGSVTPYVIVMEIKLSPESWYLHFHVVTGFVKNLRLVRKKWGYWISYEKALSRGRLANYITKYARKTPAFPTIKSMWEFANSVYKLQMSRFSISPSGFYERSGWELIGFESGVSYNCMTFAQMRSWLQDYYYSRSSDRPPPFPEVELSIKDGWVNLCDKSVCINRDLET